MQKSESVLDNLWGGFDKHIKEHCSRHIVNAWEHLWPRKEDLSRTQDWEDAEVAPLVGGLGAVNLNFGHEENMSRSITPQPPKKKSKKKKRSKGPSIELRAHRRSATRPSRRRPHAARGAAHHRQQTSMGCLPRYTFFCPSRQKKFARIRRQDLLHATTSLGFNMTTPFGSVRRVELGEKAKSAGLRGTHDGQHPQKCEVTVVRCF